MSFKRIDVAQAKSLMAEGPTTIVDIRDLGSYERGHVPNAVHVHDGNVDEFVTSTDKTIPVIVCCYHGNSSQGAAAYFVEQGFDQAYSLDGGFSAWVQSEH